jgi:hypothetical protein
MLPFDNYPFSPYRYPVYIWQDFRNGLDFIPSCIFTSSVIPLISQLFSMYSNSGFYLLINSFRLALMSVNQTLGITLLARS